MERTLEDYTVAELKDYIRGLYAIPLNKFSGADRQNLQESDKCLNALGYVKVYRGPGRIVFHKKATRGKEASDERIDECQM